MRRYAVCNFVPWWKPKCLMKCCANQLYMYSGFAKFVFWGELLTWNSDFCLTHNILCHLFSFSGYFMVTNTDILLSEFNGYGYHVFIGMWKDLCDMGNHFNFR